MAAVPPTVPRATAAVPIAPPPSTAPRSLALVILAQALPTVDELGPWVRQTFLCLYAAATLCYVLAGFVNPGTPTRPPPLSAEDGQTAGRESGVLAHPGVEFTLSRDSNRYVKGFDHYCEFVGNDIGTGNMPCFVTFLGLLALLSTFVAVRASLGMAESPWVGVSLRAGWWVPQRACQF